MKHVLITGAGSGIGRALAIEADRLGHRLTLVGRRTAALEATAAQLTGSVHVLPADITTPEGRLRIADMQAEGRLDILINNAGMVPAGPVTALDDSEIAAALALNVAAPIALTRILLPQLVASKGQIVNIGSVFGAIGCPYVTLYSASKFALRGFSEALRREIAPQGVAVTYIAPRATRTEATDGFDRLIGPMAMGVDSPETVARTAWRAITRRQREQFPASRERLFVALQRLQPRLIDRALSKMARDPAVAAAARDLKS